MVKFTAGAAALALTLAIAAPATANDLTVTHAQGETTVAANPATVLTFDIATIDTLDALGVEIAGLPGTNLPEYLSKYADDKYLKIGSLFEPDYEAVNAAGADLIIVAARSSTAYGELSKIAPTIDLSNNWATFADSIKANSRTLGTIFGKTAEVEAMIATLDEKIAATRALAADAGTGLIVLTSAGQITAYGPGSRFGWIHDTLGVTPAVADV